VKGLGGKMKVFSYRNIWQGVGVEIYRVNKPHLSISFSKSDLKKSYGINGIVNLVARGGYHYIGGTDLHRTSTTLAMTDYQGRKLSIYLKREFTDFINTLREALRERK